jgi:hypothetical protein
MKTFHQKLAKQLTVAEPDAVVKEEKHKNKLGANFQVKISIFSKYFCLTYIIIYSNYDKNCSTSFW